MSTKVKIEQDLKKAMLSGDKALVSVLRGLKSSILNVEIAQGSREQGLSEDIVLDVLAKESKKRQESADLYAQAGDSDRQKSELSEKAAIDAYLPDQITDEELATIIDSESQQAGGLTKQNMGQIIGKVKQQTTGKADGARIAMAVKERLDTK